MPLLNSLVSAMDVWLVPEALTALSVSVADKKITQFAQNAKKWILVKNCYAKWVHWRILSESKL